MRTLTVTRARLFYLCANITLAFAYYGTAELSRWLASTPQNVTPVWPPDGLAVAGVFLYGYALLPGVCLGSFLSNIWAFWDPSSWDMLLGSVSGVLGIALGTTLGTGVGVYGLRQMIGSRHPLKQVSDVVRLLLVAGLMGPTINAAVGVAMLCSLGVVPWPMYQEVWLTWWISNVAGIFIVTPAVISWMYWLHLKRPRENYGLLIKRLGKWPRRLKHYRKQGVEALLLTGGILLVGEVSFWQGYSLEYVLIPLLIWATFSFGQRGATLAAVGISTMAILGTVRSQGTFASDNLNQSLTQLQSFIAVTVFTALVLAAVLAERSHAEDRLRIAIADLAAANQDLEARVANRTQELDRKNKSLNSALQELHQAQAQVIQSEKMSSLGQMVAGIAHEINNPVNFIHGNIKHMRDYIAEMLGVVKSYQQHYLEPDAELQKILEESDLDFIEGDTQKILSSMVVGTQRIQEIVVSLRNFSRLDESDLKLANIHEGLESTLLILKHRLSLPGKPIKIHLVRDYGEVPLVECFPSALNQVVMNILNNAVDAIEQNLAHLPEGVLPTVTLRTDVVGDWVRIAIADNGSGISEAAKRKVFDPFFTTKPVGKGTGMGMSVSYQIITQKHQGKLTFDSSPDRGTEFVIEIPKQQPAVAQGPAVAHGPAHGPAQG